MKPRIFQATIFFTALLVGFGAGYAIHPHEIKDLNVFAEERDKNDSAQYRFISPLLACDGAELSSTSNKTLRILKTNLAAYLDEQKNKGALTDAAIYIRELQDGSWISINGEKDFTPGSLLKVPAVLSLFRYAQERDPSIISKQILFEGGGAQVPQHYPPKEVMQSGTVYSVEDIVRRALVYSDNDAALLISQLINKEYLLDTYSDLGISTPSMGNDLYTVNVRNYASFFRILYNATYIDRDPSEYVLGLLSQSSFTNGLRAGVPAEIAVAHKFGERSVNASVQQLHDCGIVYAKNPYIICVMTQGPSFGPLETFIGDVSKMVYTTLTAK